MADGIQPLVAHDAEAGRFSVVQDAHEAELVYRIRDGVLTVLHTGVPEAIGGRGIAAMLVREALDYARGARLRVDPACSYAAAYFRRHPEYADLLS